MVSNIMVITLSDDEEPTCKMEPTDEMELIDIIDLSDGSVIDNSEAFLHLYRQICETIDQFAAEEVTWYYSEFVTEAKKLAKKIRHEITNDPKAVDILERCLLYHQYSYYRVEEHINSTQEDTGYLRHLAHVNRMKDYEFKTEPQTSFNFIEHLVCLVQALAEGNAKFARRFIKSAFKVRRAVEKLTRNYEQNAGESEFPSSIYQTLKNISAKAGQFCIYQKEVTESASAAAKKARALLYELKTKLDEEECEKSKSLYFS